jgi:hypothetical protein
MHVSRTKDPKIVNFLTAGEGIPSAETYMHKPGVAVIVAWEATMPVAGLLVLESGKLELPEVHLAVPSRSRGPGTLVAVCAMLRWVREHKRKWLNAWTYVETPSLVTFCKRFGFIEAFTKDGETWLFLPMRTEVER